MNRQLMLLAIIMILSGGLLAAPESSRAKHGPEPVQHSAADDSSSEALPEAWLPSGAEVSKGSGGTGPLQGEEPDPENPDYTPGHLVVQFAADATEAEKRALHERYGAEVVREIRQLNIQVLKLPEDTVSMLGIYQDEDSVLFAEPDYVYTIQGGPAPDAPVLDSSTLEDQVQSLDETPNDSLYSQQWHHAKIDSPGSWDQSHGQNVIVAIIDTGVDCTHPDLQSKCVAGYDSVNRDNDPRDDHGHGTHVAGIAAAVTNNALGIAGNGWDAKIMPIKSLNSRGNGDLGWIADGVTWAADNGAHVINMSLGGRFTSRTLESAISYAIGKGIPVIAAAGNENTSNPSYPAAFSGVIGVAATTSADTKASFSNYGTYIDVAAPGVGILSSVRGGSYQAWNGTSMAAPVVAGVAALLMEQGPCRTPAQVEEILEQTAVDLGDSGWDRIFGAGRIDAGAALRYDTDPCGGSGRPSPTPDDRQNPPPTPTRRPQPTARPTDPMPVDDDLVGQLEVLINRERANYGLDALRIDEKIRKAAGKHATDLALLRDCRHEGSDGSSPADRMQREGVQRPYGEIVACGQASPEAAVSAWMGSAGHRAIILCTRCTSIGGGYYGAGDGWRRYWVANFSSDTVQGPAPTDPPPPTATQVAPPTATPEPAQPDPDPKPSPLPGSYDIELRPKAGKLGWVVSTQPYVNHFDSADTHTGVFFNRVYHGAMQFDLNPIPRGAYINFARLTMVGRSAPTVAQRGTWSVGIMDPGVDGGWQAHGYNTIHAADILSTLHPFLNPKDVAPGQANTFNFSGAQLIMLTERHLSTKRLSLRIDGPESGDFANLLSWDTGQSSTSRYDGPVLMVNYSLDGPVAPPTAKPPVGPVDPDPGPPTNTPLPPPPSRTPTAPPPPTAVPEPAEKIIEIVAQAEDVGWVRQFDPLSHLGEPNTYTGYYHQRVYKGIAQFDLSQLPKDRVITHARLTLTGQSADRLSSHGNGTWQVALLSGDVDAGWRFHGYDRINSTSFVARLQPKLMQADLGAGRENLFPFRQDELRELAWRLMSTGKISFRFDGPRAGHSNLYDWDAGYGGNPPVLTVVMGPPGSDNPLPPAPPRDAERMEAMILLINDARAQYGVPPVKTSSQLTQAAEHHTWDMARHRFFDHIGSDGSTPEERVARTGFRARAVNQLIGGQNGEAQNIVKAWMRSSEHRARILSPSMSHVGAYYDYAPGSFFGHYWTLVLAQAE